MALNSVVNPLLSGGCWPLVVPKPSRQLSPGAGISATLGPTQRVGSPGQKSSARQAHPTRSNRTILAPTRLLCQLVSDCVSPAPSATLDEALKL